MQQLLLHKQTRKYGGMLERLLRNTTGVTSPANSTQYAVDVGEPQVAPPSLACRRSTRHNMAFVIPDGLASKLLLKLLKLVPDRLPPQVLFALEVAADALLVLGGGENVA